MLETQEKWVPSLGWEDCLEKEMATLSHHLARAIPQAEAPNELQSKVRTRAGMTWGLTTRKSVQHHKVMDRKLGSH